MATSFEKDVKPYFSSRDQDHMLNNVGMFDLWNPSDVKDNFDDIENSIMAGRMPKGSPWPPDKRNEFKATFDAWRDGGFQP